MCGLKNKYFILLLIMLSLAGEMYGQKSNKNIFETPLWEVSGNGLTSPSYIFGSLHTLPGTWLDNYPTILSKLRSAQIYVGERNLFEYLQKSAETLDTSTPLIKMLNPEQYKFIDSLLKTNYKGASLDDSEAIGFTIIDFLGLAGQCLVKKGNGDNHTATNLDVTIQRKAIELKKKFVGLETESELNKLYVQGKSVMEVVDMIIRLIRNIDAPDIQEQYRQITESYLALKINYLFMAGSGNEKIIDERNLTWLPRLESLLKENSCFVHVGIGHLEYNKGLLMLLKNKGYNITPVAIR